MEMESSGGHISRSSILFGAAPEEVWFDLEQFYREHLGEISGKLGSLDDEIWGKIVLMERNRRVAKAYLRTTTVLLNGGSFGFDGKTIGFNSFDNPARDTQVEEMRDKIGEGLVLKMDSQGSIVALAKGSSPVFLQGVRHGRGDGQCYSDKVAKLKGRLEPFNEERSTRDRAVKVFDMKVFKSAIEREMQSPYPNRKELLYKTCIRISLVKDEAQALKTPCWFMVVNLVAMDMLNAKVPLQGVQGAIGHSLSSPAYLSTMGSRRSSSNDVLGSGGDFRGGSALSQSSSDLYGLLGPPAATLGRFLQQASTLQTAPPFNSAALHQLQAQLLSQAPPGGLQQLSALASHLAASLADSDAAAAAQRARSWSKSTKSSSGYASESDHFAPPPLLASSASQSIESLYEPMETFDDDAGLMDDEDVAEPRLEPSVKAMAVPKAAPTEQRVRVSAEIKRGKLGTGAGRWGDYEKDIYDSSTCSSSSRSSNSAVWPRLPSPPLTRKACKAARSSSPSIVSETNSDSQTSDSGYTGERANSSDKAGNSRRIPGKNLAENQRVKSVKDQEGRWESSPALGAGRPVPPLRRRKAASPSPSAPASPALAAHRAQPTAEAKATLESSHFTENPVDEEPPPIEYF